MSLSNSFGNLTQCTFQIYESKVEVAYRTCIKRQAVKAFSRIATAGADKSRLKRSIPLLAVETSNPWNMNINFINSMCDASAIPDEMITHLATPLVTKDYLISLMVAKFVQEQASRAYFRQVTLQADQLNSKFHFDENELLFRRSAIDGSIQIVVLTPLRQRIPTHF